MCSTCFNPSSGITAFRTREPDIEPADLTKGFNPSSGITAFRTKRQKAFDKARDRVFQSLFRDYSLSDTQAGLRIRHVRHGFQSLFRDYSLSDPRPSPNPMASLTRFNPSSGITAFRTRSWGDGLCPGRGVFQSLFRDYSLSDWFLTKWGGRR